MLNTTDTKTLDMFKQRNVTGRTGLAEDSLEGRQPIEQVMKYRTQGLIRSRPLRCSMGRATCCQS